MMQLTALLFDEEPIDGGQDNQDAQGAFDSSAANIAWS